MKQRISSLDLQLLYAELKAQLEGYRLSNIYNIADSSRQFLLKFNKPDSKLNAIIDCGLRIHLTDFNRPIPPTPSGFVVKLRKHLKSKRLTTVKRVANDRILVLSFADGQFYLVLEFFSAGNVILLDSERKIIVLQRVVHEHENKVGQTYDMFDETFLQDTTIELPQPNTHSSDQVATWLKDAKDLAQSTVKSKNGKTPKVPSIQKLLFLHEPHLSSDLISRNLKAQGITPNSSCLDFEDKVDSITDLLNATESEVSDLLMAGCKTGYIVAKKNPNHDAEKGDASLEFVYEQFHPFPPYTNQEIDKETKVMEVTGEYNKTVDEFFSTIESTKYALRIQNQEFQAKKRLDDAKLDNAKRIQALVDVQEKNEARGHAIIAHADLVEEAQNAVKTLVNQQMDWKTIEMLISNEQKKNNEIAQLIRLPLDLENNKITLTLVIDDSEASRTSESDYENETSSDSEFSSNDSSDGSDTSLSDFEADEENRNSSKNVKGHRKSSSTKGRTSTIDATVDLTLSAYANASNYFNIKKSALEKQKKGEQNSSKALKNIEQRIERDLKKKLKTTHDVLNRTRTPYFFEKYNWFISSEGFLVLMGKSGQETDQIFSKYANDSDIFVSNSFDTHVWIKNPDETEVPPNTLMQAGIMCMSASPAWSKKIQSSAWWCFVKNLSKFDSYGGEVLPPGTFLLKDEKKKSYLPPSQLVMGFGFLWKVKGTEDEDEDEMELEKLEEDLLQRGVENLKDIDLEEEDAEIEYDQVQDARVEEDQRGDARVDNDRVRDTLFEDDQVENSDLEATLDNLQKLDVEPVRGSGAHVKESVTQEDIAGSQGQAKNVRGKKGKLKKMQRKYADQDEEERQMRLEVLGTLKGVERERSKMEEELLKQQDREQKKARREKQKQQQSLKFSSKEKVVVDYHKIMDELSPMVTDKVVKEVIPIFAPWAALNKYKYKVKVQPGNAKKTKTLNEILHYFSSRKVDESSADKELDWPREHELIKGLKDIELVSLLYTDKLKVTIPGQNESKGKSKGSANNKSKKKGKK
ncbi:LANO_0B02322g1_1 [Lachancea nothofagi CBS 11611]|uniref:Ribosome quality control complex subunit 2 n=1 Tax=Lachancea nothofagi CBS 11611 TaxID=1266666 RepID=A0A1G4IVX0_9SACH|nr:LANO_0B02322g1_1 [Lachancea nothofagi CBS 11611]